MCGEAGGGCLENTGTSKMKEIMLECLSTAFLLFAYFFRLFFFPESNDHCPPTLVKKQRENKILDQFNIYLTQMKNLVV